MHTKAPIAFISRTVASRTVFDTCFLCLSIESDEPVTAEICGVCEFMHKTFKLMFFQVLTDECKRMLMLQKENIWTKKWERKTILICLFMPVLGHSLLIRLPTVPHCLIQQDG